MYLNSFNYSVEIIHPKLGGFKIPFTSISGFGVSKGFKEVREGGNNGPSEQLTGEVSLVPITFKKGLVEDESIVLDIIQSNFNYSGVNSVFGARDESLMDIVIKSLTRQGNETGKGMRLIDCQIGDVNIGEFNAMESDLLYVDFTVVYEGLRRV